MFIDSQPRLLYCMHTDRLVRGSISHDIVHLITKLDDSLVDSSHSYSHVDNVRVSVQAAVRYGTLLSVLRILHQPPKFYTALYARVGSQLQLDRDQIRNGILCLRNQQNGGAL